MKKKMSTINRSNLRHHSMNKFQRMVWISFIFLFIATQFALAHGTVTSPPSRVWNCYQENPENPDSAPCVAAVASHGTQPLYDWNEINQANANGDHIQFVPDGNLASGGRPGKYGGMDQVRTDWVATSVSPGPFTVTWTISAPHATSYYQVYITKADWTPDQPLAWDKLELLVQTAPSDAADSHHIPVTLPNRTGKHVIYSIWQRSDSPEAFYSTSDVDFGMQTNTDEQELTENFTLKQNYPNPFNASSIIGYQLKKGELVTLKVYDIYGKEISTLVDTFQSAGEYQLTFNGKNLSNGIYIYILQVGDMIEKKRMVLQK